jgi:serine/threonine protein kinase
MKFTYAPGDRPVEGYTLKHGIGRGGFGEVYAGVSDGGKEVALKLVQRNLEVELRGVGQCLNLKHPNLVAVYDVKRAENGDCWVIMEHVSGQTLEKAIAEHPQGMPPEEALTWLRGICEGVGYLHDQGVVHRDLKPGNLFLENGTVKIGDYGLSKFMSASRRSGQTASIGTVHYMAPEIVQGRYGKEVDLYSLGIILYEMLTGRVPFDGDSPGEILMKHLTAWPDLNVLQPSYRPVVARLLDKDPQRRYPSMQEMLADLNDCAGKPVISIPQLSASIQAPSDQEIPVPVSPSAPDRGSFGTVQPTTRESRARARAIAYPFLAILFGGGAFFMILADHVSGPPSGNEGLFKSLGGGLLVTGGVLLLLLFFQAIADWYRALSKKHGPLREEGAAGRPQWVAFLGPLTISLLIGLGTGILVVGGMIMASHPSNEERARALLWAKSAGVRNPAIADQEFPMAAVFIGFGAGFLACALSASLFFLRQHGKKKGAELADTPQPAKTVVPESHLQPTGAWHPPPEEG